MAKKLVAKTAIKASNDVYVAEGELVDATKFSREELKALYDAGAIAVADAATLEEAEAAAADKDKAWEVPDETGPDTSGPDPSTTGGQKVPMNEDGTVKDSPTGPAKVAPTKATDVKK